MELLFWLFIILVAIFTIFKSSYLVANVFSFFIEILAGIIGGFLFILALLYLASKIV